MQKRVHLERFRAKPWAVDAAFTEERGLYQFHGDCEKPFELYVRALPDKLMVGLGKEPDMPVIGSLLGRCRKCAACREHRSRLWAARACAEVALSGRTWFGTLTLRPQEQFIALTKARRAARLSAVDWDELSEGERFSRCDRQIARDIRGWLDRVRKRAGRPIRYLLVCEGGELKDEADPDGARKHLHYHCLVHELGETVTHRVLTETWRAGFSKFKLVPAGEPEAVFYVCKYLSKSVVTRVRASFRYGRAAWPKDAATKEVAGAISDDALHPKKEEIKSPETEVVKISDR